MSAERLSNQDVLVWHVVGPMNPGGAEVMVMELLRNKSPHTRINFLVHVRGSSWGEVAAFDEEIAARGGNIMRILTPSQGGVFKYLRDFAATVRSSGKPDVVHIHLNARSGIVALAARLCGIRRIIVHSHAALTFRGSALYRLAARIELLASKLIFLFAATDYWGCSEAAIDSLFPKLPKLFAKPMFVINNAIDMDRFMSLTENETRSVRTAMKVGDQEILIGSVGRLVRHKNVSFLVSVLSSIRRNGVPAKLALVGREQDEGYAEGIRDLIAEAGLHEYVIWCGERKDVAPLMGSFDVFASAALKEGFGLVALEAQAAGTPCVISLGFPRSVDMNLGLVEFQGGFQADEWATAIVAAVTRRRQRDQAIVLAFSRAGFVSSENTARIERAYRDSSCSPTLGGV